MKCLDDHHSYELDNFEGETKQHLSFIKKEVDQSQPEAGTLVTINNGTTNEEVLRVLIHRLNGLYNKFPSDETDVAITKCKEALESLEARTKDREKRGVEGKHLS